MSVDAIPQSPPEEVFAAIAQAAQSYESLRVQGLAVAYSQDPATGGVTAELRSTSGAVVRTLAPSEALALAAGVDLPSLAGA